MINQVGMERKQLSWILLLMLSIAEAVPVINGIQNTSSYLIPCEEGWYLFGDKCYKVFEKTKALAWKPAELICETHHGSLVTIKSKELQDFLTTFLLLDVKSNVWIGLHDQQEESIYAWADGSVANYRYWDRDEPSGRRIFTEDCVEMRYTAKDKTGMWNDVICDTNLPFMCQRNKSEQAMNHDPRFCTGDNEGAWKYQNSCYHTVSEEMSWDDAENYCQTALNGHLLTILDSKANLFLNDVLSTFSREFWIGIKINDSAHQIWSSAWIVKFKKWEPDHKHFIKGTCAHMTEKRLWSSAPCFQKLPFVCEVPQVRHSLKQAPEGWRCPELSQDWKDLGGDTCYIFETRKPKKWHEANFVCFKKGGHLASINSVAESNAIHPRVIGVHERMLIGLHRSLSNNSLFEWADGTVLDYQNWRHGEPNDKNEACGEFWTDDMQWNDVPCHDAKAYVCSAKKVPPYFLESNGSALIDSQLLEETNCSGDGSSNAVLAVLLVAVILVCAAVFTNYVYKNHCRKNKNQSWKYLALSFSAGNGTASNALTRDDSVHII